MEFLSAHWLDITTTALGLAYILLEYKASVWMWVVGFVMQSLGIVLYYQKGLYADCGMEFYYLAMTVYGFIAWMRHKQKASDLPIRHMPKKKAFVWLGAGLVIWAFIYFVLSRFTDLYVIWIFVALQMSEWIKCIVGVIMVKKGIWIKNIVK